jgi:hypothetical protein
MPVSPDASALIVGRAWLRPNRQRRAARGDGVSTA